MPVSGVGKSPGFARNAAGFFEQGSFIVDIDDVRARVAQKVRMRPPVLTVSAKTGPHPWACSPPVSSRIRNKALKPWRSARRVPAWGHVTIRAVAQASASAQVRAADVAALSGLRSPPAGGG